GSTSAFVYSFYMWIQMILHYQNGQFTLLHEIAHNMYFESAAMILTLISLGKYLEDKSKKKTSEAVYKLMDLASKHAIVIRDGKEIEIEVEDIIIDDILLIKPGESIPVDGIIVEGQSSIDESSISGESIPLEKGVNDEVISGTFNTTGAFKMQAKRVGNETTLSQIIQLVEDANSSKPELAKIADKVSGIFVPVVIVIALITFATWLLLGYSFAFALSCGIAVLVISCPCALGLATPTAIMVGSGKAAENGILLKRSESLEQIHAIDTIILDKTGTITYGKPSVTNIISEQPTYTILQIAASLEANSEHPLSTAIMTYAKLNNIVPLANEEFVALTGKGATAKIKGVSYFVGNKKLMNEFHIKLNDYAQKADTYAAMGEIPIFVANEKEVMAMICLSDQIKPSSIKAIKKMKALGLRVLMVTGDNKLTSQQIQKQLAIDEVIAEVLPQDKEKIVDDLQKQNKKVMMVGDGINDAPALTRSDVGIAIGAGSDIALECADVILIKNDLQDVLNTITLSNAVIKNIKQNLFWAFFYNVIGIPLAAGIFYLPFAIQLNPMFAAAAMSLSSICVVTNALRLKQLKLSHY
ncbi:MAG: copper-translocating P-type ATPase, partial [Erysipelotrichia bacterium]|nr:copper-translocating P-type ATPase [Erysipelotrichia bacterium]